MEAARPATPQDRDQIVELAAEAIAELTPTRGGELWSRREARLAPLGPSVDAALADAGHEVWVGTIDDVVLGYAIARVEVLPDGGILGVVEDIYVTADARGVGIGEAMMDAVITWCDGRGCMGVDAVALPGNRQTKNFFERFGLTARAIVVHRALGVRAPLPTEDVIR